MGRRPGSRASRAERRMQKERAASALAHGLPVPTPLPTRARTSEYSSSRPPALPPVPSSSPPGRRMPLAVKLLAGGLGLLVIVYGLTLFRDRKDAEAARIPAAPEAEASLVAPPVAPLPAWSAALASAPAIAVSANASASGMPMMPQLAQRMKSVVAAIQGHKPNAAAPSTSAVQPNVAAALGPANTAPADSAVK